MSIIQEASRVFSILQHQCTRLWDNCSQIPLTCRNHIHYCSFNLLLLLHTQLSVSILFIAIVHTFLYAPYQHQRQQQIFTKMKKEKMKKEKSTVPHFFHRDNHALLFPRKHNLQEGQLTIGAIYQEMWLTLLVRIFKSRYFSNTHALAWFRHSLEKILVQYTVIQKIRLDYHNGYFKCISVLNSYL